MVSCNLETTLRSLTFDSGPVATAREQNNVWMTVDDVRSFSCAPQQGQGGSLSVQRNASEPCLVTDGLEMCACVRIEPKLKRIFSCKILQCQML